MIRRLLHVLMLLLFVAIGLFFGTLNQTPARVDFLFVIVEWPLALALASFFFGGALFGGLLTWAGSWLNTRQRIRALKRSRQAAASSTGSRAIVRASGSSPGTSEPG